MNKFNKSVCLLKLTLLGVILIFSLTTDAKVWILSNAYLEVQFDDQSALLSVTKKSCNKLWQQSSLNEKFTVLKTEQKGNTLNEMKMTSFPVWLA